MRPRVLLALSAGIAVAVLTYAVLSPNGLARSKDLDDERQALTAETAALTAENARLAERARVLRGDDPQSAAVLEKAAREELGMVKKGEIVVVVPETAAQ
jgi:cell division protein FtsB